MSIVAVHGPTMITGSGGAGAVTEAPQVRSVADMTNGWKFTFEATDQSRAAADYDWAFPGGTPATATDTKGPVTVTYASAGTKTATLTIAAGAGPPAGGAYPINVEATGATAGTPRLAEGEEPPADEAPAEEAFDPADYTVDDVKAYVEENPDQAIDVLAAERAGKNRSTLVSFLEEYSTVE